MDDFKIRPGRELVGQKVKHGEQRRRSRSAGKKQRRIVHLERLEQLAQHRESHGDMENCHGQGQVEHQQHLLGDDLFDLPVAHAHILEDVEAVMVVEALGDLLVVDNQHRRNQEQRHKEDAHKQQAPIHLVKAARCGSPPR